VQYMSAGTGVFHSEHNLGDETLRLLPKALQWNFLREHPHLIGKICEDFFAFESLHLTESEWEKIINCMGNK
ncbi:hypothetical protein ACT4UL_21810, partial [Bacillus sp. HC-TM]